MNAEALTYGAFFGLLLVMGALELAWPISRERPRRLVRWTGNATLTTLWVLAGTLVPLSLLTAAEYAARRDIGLLNWAGVSAWAAFGCGILGRSLISYAIHVAMHKAPVLWRLHRVHHTDTHLDISTTARFHPLEALASAPLALAGTVALGIPPVAVLLYEVLDATVVVFSHANLRLPRWLDNALGIVFITPNTHRLHHSALREETDSNYGATFSIWDRLFGTYRSGSDMHLATLKLGLGEVPAPAADNIFWLLVSPFIGLNQPGNHALPTPKETPR